jgi:hypothetical protein
MKGFSGESVSGRRFELTTCGIRNKRANDLGLIVRICKGKGPRGRPRVGSSNNIKMYSRKQYVGVNRTSPG